MQSSTRAIFLPCTVELRKIILYQRSFRTICCEPRDTCFFFRVSVRSRISVDSMVFRQYLNEKIVNLPSELFIYLFIIFFFLKFNAYANVKTSLVLMILLYFGRIRMFYRVKKMFDVKVRDCEDTSVWRNYHYYYYFFFVTGIRLVYLMLSG